MKKILNFLVFKGPSGITFENRGTGKLQITFQVIKIKMAKFQPKTLL